MKPEVVAAWSAICRRALNADLDDCAPVMVPAEDVAAAVYGVWQPLGSRETRIPYRSDKTDAVILAVFRDACASGDFLLRILKPEARDTVRDLAAEVVALIMLMAASRHQYGPVPAGLTGRDLGLAALALEILGTGSAQLSLGRKYRAAH